MQGLSERVFWQLVIERWRTVLVQDLHQHYGIDTDDTGFWGRPFYWLREKVMGLLDIPDARLFHVVEQEQRAQAQQGGTASAA